VKRVAAKIARVGAAQTVRVAPKPEAEAKKRWKNNTAMTTAG
jgi:hypothetical protein